MIYKALHKIIDEEVIIPVNMYKKNIIVKETGQQAKLKRIIINGFTDTEKCIAFKLDYKNFRLSQYVSKSQKKINKGCDAVIITEIKSGKYIFFCELKSDSPKGHENQFLSSHAFIDYIDSIVDKFYQFSIKEFKKIYVLFTSKRIPKNVVHPSAQRGPVKWLNDIPLFREDNCKRGWNENFIDLKKYTR